MTARGRSIWGSFAEGKREGKRVEDLRNFIRGKGDPKEEGYGKDIGFLLLVYTEKEMRGHLKRGKGELFLLERREKEGKASFLWGGEDC